MVMREHDFMGNQCCPFRSCGPMCISSADHFVLTVGKFDQFRWPNRRTTRFPERQRIKFFSFIRHDSKPARRTLAEETAFFRLETSATFTAR